MRPPRSEHRVRRERLVVDAATPALALALRPRLEDLNRRALLPVIEAVLAEVDPPGRRVRIDRLELDLGEVPAGALDAELPRRLAAELRRALGDALRGGPAEPVPGVAWRAEADARAELLEWQLLRGTLPYWAPRAARSLEALVVRAAAEAPASLAATVRRLGRRRVVLERLAAQLRDPALAALVRVLEPVHAALVLAYVTDLRRVHRRAPLLPLGEPPFRRLLWVLTQAYLVRDPGSQFNRKSFLRSLLRGMAADQGLDYAALLATLRTGLQRMRRHRAAGASLPAVLAALLRDLERDAADSADQRDDRDPADAPSWDDADPGDAGSSADAGDPAASSGPQDSTGSTIDADSRDAAKRVDGAHPAHGRHGRQTTDTAYDADSGDAAGPALRENAVDASGRQVSIAPSIDEDVRARPARAHPAQWSDGRDVTDAADAPLADRPGHAADGEELDGWAAAVAWKMPGQGNAAAGADSVADARPVPGALAASSGTPGRRDVDPHRLRNAGDALRPSPGGADLRDPDGRGIHEATAYPADAGVDAAAFVPYDRAEALAYLLRHGVLPWDAVLRDAALDAGALAASLADLPHALLLAVLRADDPAARRRSLASLARWISDDGFARLLPRLVPAAARADTPFAQALRAAAASAPDRRAFLARVANAALDGAAIDLDALARPRGGDGEGAEPRPAELAAWPAHLLASVLTRALRAGAASTRDDPAPEELLDALAATHPADARHYLRAAGRDDALAPALARCVPAPLHDRLVGLLAPAAQRAIGALQAALAALPAPERRFSAHEARQAVLVEVMRLGEGVAPGEAFFARVLARLFGRRLPGAAGAHLLAPTEGWIHPAGVPAAQVDAFRAAVAAAGTRPDAASAGPERAPPAGTERARVSGALREAVFAFLLGREPADAPAGGEMAAPAAGLSPDALRDALRRMADEALDELVPFVRRHSADRRVRERWVRLLPQSALARLGRLLGPRHHAALLDTAETLAAAWSRAAPPGHPALAGRAVFWDFLLGFLAGGARAGRGDERLVEAFFADRAARCRRLSPPPDLAQTGAALLRAATRLAHARGSARLRDILHRRRERLLAAWEPAGSARRSLAPPPGPAPRPTRGARADAGERRPGRRRPPSPPAARGPGEDEGDPVYVGNAGLVLAGAFLPHLFQQLELLRTDDDGRTRMRDADAVSRGVHLLQYLVDGNTETPEPLLVLNKVLCGVPPETPVERGIQPSEREREMCDRLLAAMLARWPALSNTSVAGLRETFLRREGRLELAPERVRLTVQRKTLDVLVDQVPWSVSVIYHAWMPGPLRVTW